LAFPGSPSIGDTYDEAGVQYIWDGTAWVFLGQVGPQGKRSGLEYVFSTTTTAADPGAGFMRYNNATIASVTSIYLDNQDFLTVSPTAWVDTWGNGGKGTLTIKNQSGTLVNIFDVAGVVVDSTGYRTIPVSYVSGTLPSNGTKLFIDFSRNGSGGGGGAYVIDGGTPSTDYTAPAAGFDCGGVA